jgi:hypothetical protein
MYSLWWRSFCEIKVWAVRKSPFSARYVSLSSIFHIAPFLISSIQFSIRAICCVVGLLLVVCVGVGYAVGANYTEHGEGALNFVAHASINIISTAQVLALFAGSTSTKTSKLSSSKSQTQSHIER